MSLGRVCCLCFFARVRFKKRLLSLWVALVVCIYGVIRWVVVCLFVLIACVGIAVVLFPCVNCVLYVVCLCALCCCFVFMHPLFGSVCCGVCACLCCRARFRRVVTARKCELVVLFVLVAISCKVILFLY